MGNLIQDSVGNLYGVTISGGTSTNCSGGGCGAIYKLSAAGQETLLYSLNGKSNGANPVVYGATDLGGDFGFGTIFKVDPNGQKTTLHSFTGSDGAYPTRGVVADNTGNLYGTTQEGGAHKVRSVFMFDTAGNLTVMHSFAGGFDGAYPDGEVLLNLAAGKLYGTTVLGGAHNQGIVFEVKY